MTGHIRPKSPLPPSFPKRGNSSLLQREGRRDLVFGVYTIMDWPVFGCATLDPGEPTLAKGTTAVGKSTGITYSIGRSALFYFFENFGGVEGAAHEGSREYSPELHFLACSLQIGKFFRRYVAHDRMMPARRLQILPKR